MRFTLSQDASERYQELLDDIANMLRPVAERAIIRKIKDERQGMFFFEEQATAFALEARQVMLESGAPRDVADMAMREVRRRLMNEDVSSPPDDPILDDEVVRTHMVMALAWVTMLQLASEGEPPAATLDLSVIGEDMLPTTLPPSQLEALDEALSHTVVTPDDFRRFLRFLRGERRCQGPLLPEMLELLALDGITVTGA